MKRIELPICALMEATREAIRLKLTMLKMTTLKKMAVVKMTVAKARG